MVEIFTKIDEAFLANEPFALAGLPDSNEVIAFFQNENGELMSEEGDHWFTKAFDSSDFPRVETSFEVYEDALSQAISTLKSGDLSKVVLSKIKKSSTSVQFKPSEIFEVLRQKYPTAFKFIYRLRDQNVWFGASPEILLDKQGVLYKTTALAGTRIKKGTGTAWGMKEIHEQKVVLEYLMERIKEDKEAQLVIHPTETVEAGHLEHIRTNVEFESTRNLSYWIDSLHPTPAVCGLPKHEAFEFITKNEKHSRRNYTGVVGIVNAQNAKLFVQLRCAEFDIQSNEYWIYTGGGIMHDSDIKSEWQEAENKANVMLNVLSELASQRI